MNNKKDMLVDMSHVIGHLVYEYGVPILSFEQLTTLGQRAVNVYRLGPHAKRITFPELCEYIKAFISTAFGLKVLKQIQAEGLGILY